MAKPQSKERAFSFLKVNERPPKPRTRGVTEIRGPYYTPMGKRYLEDIPRDLTLRARAKIT